MSTENKTKKGRISAKLAGKCTMIETLLFYIGFEKKKEQVMPFSPNPVTE